MRRLLISVVLLFAFVAGAAPLNVAKPASAAVGAPVFLSVDGFATKTGYRGVFTWKTDTPIAGEVRYGASPTALTQTVHAPGLPDISQIAVADGLTVMPFPAVSTPLVPVGAPVYYQVVDTITGAKSAVKSFKAANAYNDWDPVAKAYNINLLVTLDTKSLPTNISSELALADIAAGVNVYAERLNDALDGYARVGKVVITDTALDYAANIPNAPAVALNACPPQGDAPQASLADVVIQTTVPFDSHTYGGFRIDNPCTSFYVGRVGQLVVPWTDDLHLGYVMTHEMMHYAFNAPDLYAVAATPATTDANCANATWDGSVMHNTGGWVGNKWLYTELDRSPTLTPCTMGNKPYTWASLRYLSYKPDGTGESPRYVNVPPAGAEPIQHVIDTLPRGNPDGGALDIHILNRAPASSTLSAFVPNDSGAAPVVCTSESAQVVDPAGDANEVVGTATPLPSQDNLDIVEGRIAWNQATNNLLFTIKVKDLTATPPLGAVGEYFDYNFTHGGTSFYLTLRRSLVSGESFSLGRFAGTPAARSTVLSGLAGKFDNATDLITVNLPVTGFNGIAGVTPFGLGSQITNITIVGRRDVVVLVPDADTAVGQCPYNAPLPPAPVLPPAIGDFDGNGATDVAVYRPSTGTWFVRGTTLTFGIASDVAVPADYNGDRSADVAVFRPSTGEWFVLGSASTTFGAVGDIPVPADYNGDGKDDIAVFRPSTGGWFVLGGSSPTFGQNGDVPVPADYNGDGKDDIAVFRPSTGEWFILGAAGTTFGAVGDIPVPADYNGDGKADVTVFRPSSGYWYTLGGQTAWYGANGDVPVPGDYNADGKAEVAIFRPSAGEWHVMGGAATLFGQSGDVALPAPAATRR